MFLYLLSIRRYLDLSHPTTAKRKIPADPLMLTCRLISSCNVLQVPTCLWLSGPVQQEYRSHRSVVRLFPFQPMFDSPHVNLASYPPKAWCESAASCSRPRLEHIPFGHWDIRNISSLRRGEQLLTWTGRVLILVNATYEYPDTSIPRRRMTTSSQACVAGTPVSKTTTRSPGLLGVTGA